MPPVDVSDGTGEVKSRQGQKSGRPSGTELKQFHRKSLGEWDFLETVGAGSMGKVKLAKHRYTKEVCAIKIVNRATNAFLHKEQSLPPPKKRKRFWRGRRNWKKRYRGTRELLGKLLWDKYYTIPTYAVFSRCVQCQIIFTCYLNTFLVVSCWIILFSMVH